jgi:hypothetical protein
MSGTVVRRWEYSQKEIILRSVIKSYSFIDRSIQLRDKVHLQISQRIFNNYIR